MAFQFCTISFAFLLLSINYCCAQFDELCSEYDIITTIAGKGDFDNGGINGWLEEYEGGKATEAELSRPHMAMADAAGNIYIADKEAHAIRKVDIHGVITTVAGTSTAGDGNDGVAIEQALNAPNGLWVKEDGSFYILDLNNNKIRRVDTGGNMTTIIDTAGISLGRGLWVSKGEDTIWYASGSQVKMWTQESGITSYASGFGGLGNIVQDPQGLIVATDRTANLVYRISKDGHKEIIAGNGTASGGGDGFPALETGFHGVRGIWFLENATYFLATHEGSQIWYIDSDSIAHLFLNGLEGDEYHTGDGEHFQTPGYKISEARAVTVDYHGNVLITENDRGFIRRIKKKDFNYLVKSPSNNSSMELKVYPSPFKLTTTIKYTLVDPAFVSLKIYNSIGELIEVLQNKNQLKGEHSLKWEATNRPGGIYYLRFTAGEQSKTEMVLLQN